MEKRISNVWMFDVAKRVAAPFLVKPFSQEGLRFSPDGKWVAFSSNESGRAEVYAQRFPDSDGKIMLSRNGGRMPVWRGDGREMYYISADQAHGRSAGVHRNWTLVFGRVIRRGFARSALDAVLGDERRFEISSAGLGRRRRSRL
jgi:Tol biopolymer transport system component